MDRQTNLMKGSVREEAKKDDRSILSFFFGVVFLATLAACGGGGGSSGDGGGGGIALSGTVMGGTSPIVSSKVTLYQAGVISGGNAVPLESTSTAADGTFSFSYTVPSTGSYLYYVEATGGNPGTGTNSLIDLLSVAGVTGSQLSNVTINEITTVATTHAFYNLMSSSSPGQISSSSFNSLQSALSVLTAMVDLSKGTILSTNSDSNLTSHANLLAICVESSNDCSTEESDLGLNPSSSDLANIAYGLHTAGSPALLSLSNLLSSPPISLPFTSSTTSNSSLLSAGAILTNALPFTYGSTPAFMAFDASGNIWSAAGSKIEKFPSANLSSPVTFCSSGCTYNGSYGFNGSNNLAVDGGGNIWVANSTGNSVTEIPAANPSSPITFCSSGCTHTSSAYQFNNPSALAIDGNNNVWIANSTGNSVTEIPAANPSSPVTFCSSGCSNSSSSYKFSGPGNLIVDGNNNVWILNTTAASITTNTSTANVSGGYNTTTTAVSTEVITEIPSSNTSAPVTFCASGCTYSYNISNLSGLAADPSGNIWFLYSPSSSTTTTTFTCTSSSPCATLGPSQGIGPCGGLLGGGCPSGAPSIPTANALGKITVTDPSSPVTFCASGCTNNGAYNLSGANNVAIDASGNIWVTEWVSNSTILGSLTEIPASNPSSPVTFCASGCTNTNSYNFNDPNLVRVDASGNVWVLNSTPGNQCNAGGPTIAGCSPTVYGPTVLVGIAAPTKTPLNGLPTKP